MTPWLLTGGLSIILPLVVLLYRTRLSRAEDAIELWRTQAGRLTAEINHQAAAFLDERKRLEGTIRVLQQQRAEASRRTAALADADPTGFVRGELLGASGAYPEADPGAHAEVSRPPATEPSKGGGRGRD